MKSANVTPLMFAIALSLASYAARANDETDATKSPRSTPQPDPVYVAPNPVPVYPQYAPKTVATYSSVAPYYPNPYPSPADEVIGVMRVKHSAAGELAKTLQQLIRNGSVIVANERTNSLILRGNADERMKIEALVEKLDQPLSPKESPAKPRLESESDHSIHGTLDFVISLPLQREDAAARNRIKLHDQLAELEQASLRIAEQARAFREGTVERDKLQEKLVAVVRQAFEARRRLQADDIEQQRQQLAAAERRMATREDLKEAIIGKRIVQLLDEESLEWSPEGRDLHEKLRAANPPAIPAPLSPAIANASHAAPPVEQILFELIAFEADAKTAAALGVEADKGSRESLATHEATEDFVARLEQQRKSANVKILSRPKLMTTLNRPASFVSGGEFPLPVPQSDGQVAVEYRQHGIRVDLLATRPNPERLRVELRWSLSELDQNRTVRVAGMDVPGVRSRMFDTAIELPSPPKSVIFGPLLSSDSNRASYLYLRPEFVSPHEPIPADDGCASAASNDATSARR